MKMQLWKKETSAKDALFVDIFTASYCPPNYLEFEHKNVKRIIADFKSKNPWQKSHSVAVESRNAGNSYFLQAKFSEAIGCYNKSLCFAENGSENISLAYANRSTCFFHLKNYEKCLIDIELSIEAGYPDKLKAKLINRRADCEKFISEGLSAKPPQLKLSVEAHPMDPNMAKTIRADLDHQKGIVYTAIEDLSVGQIVICEPCYVGESYTDRYLCCNICLKKNQNLIPCENCVISLHCKDECEERYKALHPIECDIKKCPIITNLSLINMQIPLVRSILLAIRAFPSIDDLIKCVEKTVISRSKSFKPPTFENDQAKYRAFLTCGSAQPECGYIPGIYSYYLSLMNQKDIAAIFNTKRYQRFLAHLLMLHSLILQEKVCISKTKNVIPGAIMADPDALVSLEQNMTLHSPLNHSCAPNISTVSVSGRLAIIVIRPIKKGEHLYIDRAPYYTVESTKTRLASLRKWLKFDCKCDRCMLRLEKNPSNKKLKSDPEYMMIRMLGHHLNTKDPEQSEIDLAEPHKELCERYLQKYGREPWCEELEMVINMYAKTLWCFGNSKW